MIPVRTAERRSLLAKSSAISLHADTMVGNLMPLEAVQKFQWIRLKNMLVNFAPNLTMHSSKEGYYGYLWIPT